MSDHLAQIVFRLGERTGQVFDMGDKPFYLGRDPQNDVVFKDAEVSRRHCTIIHEAGAFFIEDFDSTNGTFINKRQVMGLMPLENGDEVQLGETISFAFRLSGYMETVVGRRKLVEQRKEGQTGSFGVREMPASPPPKPSLPANTPAPKNRRTLWLGCGCLGLFLLLLLIIALLFYLNVTHPDLLYRLIAPILKWLQGG